MKEGWCALFDSSLPQLCARSGMCSTEGESTTRRGRQKARHWVERDRHRGSGGRRDECSLNACMSALPTDRHQNSGTVTLMVQLGALRRRLHEASTREPSMLALVVCVYTARRVGGEVEDLLITPEGRCAAHTVESDGRASVLLQSATAGQQHLQRGREVPHICISNEERRKRSCKERHRMEERGIKLRNGLCAEET